MADEYSEGGEGIPDKIKGFLDGAYSAVKELYSSTEQKYYAFVDYLEDEKNIPVKKYFVEPFENAGIPTFPVILLLILLLLLLLLFLLWPRGPPSLEVQVLSGSKAVEGAFMTLNGTATGGKALELETDRNGKAKFNNLKKGGALLEVAHDDYAFFNKSIQIKGRDKLKVELEPISVEKVDFEIQVSSDSNPLPGAKVELTYSKNKKTLTSDSQGRALIKLPINVDLTAVAYKEGYQNAAKTARSNDRKLLLLLARKAGPDATNPDDNQEKKEGVLIIYTTDENNLPLKASVEIFNSRVGGDALKKIITDSNGKAEVKGFIIGTPLKLVATWTGFQDAKATLTLRELSEAVLILRKGKTDKKTSEILVADAKTRRPIEGADVTVYNSDNEKIANAKADASGKTSFELKAADSFYAIAEASGYTFEKGAFRAGDRKTIYLRKLEVNEKKFMLTVKALDEDGHPHSRTSINFYDARGEFVPPQTIYTDAAGNAKTPIMPGTYYIKAARDSLFGKGQITIANGTENSELAITMYFPRGYVKVEAKTLQSLPVNSFSVIATDMVKNEATPSRACTGSCSFWIRGFRRYNFRGASEGFGDTYFDVTVTDIDQSSKAPGEALPDGSPANATFQITRTLWFNPANPSASPGASANPSAGATASPSPGANPLNINIAFDGLYSESNPGVKVTQVRKGRNYIARFAIDFGLASRKGFYFRVGNTPSTNGDPGFLESLYYSSGSAPSRSVGSATYSGTCSLLQIPSLQAAHVREAVSDYGFAGVGMVNYLVSVATSASGASYTIYYQGRGTNSQGIIASSPSGTTTWEACAGDAQTATQTFPIEACGTLNAQCCDDGCNQGLTCSGGICKEPGAVPINIFSCAAFNVTMSLGAPPRPNCDRIIFKVDSIFPADAIRMRVYDSTNRETDNFNLKFSDKNNPSLNVNECFTWASSFSTGGKALRYWPKGNCPYKPSGNSVPAAEFYMNITDIITQKTQTITIKVENETTFPMNVPLNAIDASYIQYKSDPGVKLMVPKSYFKQDDDDPYLFPVYILNNRQLEIENDDIYAGVFDAGVFHPAVPGVALAKNNNKGYAKLIAWDVSDWRNRLGAGKPLQLLTSNTVDRNFLTIPQAQTVQGLTANINSQAAQKVGGISSGTAFSAFPSERIANFIDKALYAALKGPWRRAYNNSVMPVAQMSDLEPFAPMKYFVASPETNLPTFSMVIAERADTIYNYYLKNVPKIWYAVPNNFLPAADRCKVRGGLFKLTTRISRISDYRAGFTMPYLEPMQIAITTNSLSCASFFACNMITERQKTGIGKLCFQFDSPIIPDGTQLGIPDLRKPYTDITGTGAPLTFSTFYLTDDAKDAQQVGLEYTGINYMDEYGNFSDVEPYHIEAYPNVFANVPNSGGGLCAPISQIASRCTCEGTIQDPSLYTDAIYCCNDKVETAECYTLVPACTLGAQVPSSGCNCGPYNPKYSGYCCDNGASGAAYQLNACEPVCADSTAFYSTCWCGGSKYGSGICCGGVYTASDVCPIAFDISAATVNADQITETSARINWQTTNVSVNNFVIYDTNPAVTPSSPFYVSVSGQDYTNSQHVPLINLVAGTTYYYYVTSCEAENPTNCVQFPQVGQQPLTFTTTAAATHKECVSGACVPIPGAGSNLCTGDAQCAAASPTPVPGTQCTGSGPYCCDYRTGPGMTADFVPYSSCNYYEWDNFGNCVPIDVTTGRNPTVCGTYTCGSKPVTTCPILCDASTGMCPAAPATHSECINSLCTIVSGAGTNQCSADSDCAPAAPVVSNMRATSINENTATIAWDTNPATSMNLIGYGATGEPGYGSYVQTNPASTTHSKLISGLSVGTTYSWNVKSCLDWSNEATCTLSAVSTFTTAACGNARCCFTQCWSNRGEYCYNEKYDADLCTPRCTTDHDLALAKPCRGI